MSILQGLVPVAVDMVSAQLAAFSGRLANELLKLSSQTVRPNEASLSMGAFNQLKKNGAGFCLMVSACLNESLQQEVRAIEAAGPVNFSLAAQDLSLVSYDEMESTVLLGKIAQAMEGDSGEMLAALNLRIAHLLRREEMNVLQNPFRPTVFLRAVYEAWCKFDAVPESHSLVLRLLRPDVFLQITPILRTLNDALIARGILPVLTRPYRSVKAEKGLSSTNTEKSSGLSAHHKLQNWLLSQPKEHGADGGAVNPVIVPVDGKSAICVAVMPELFDCLTGLQKQFCDLTANGASLAYPHSELVLRRIKSYAPQGTLTPVVENTIELLAKIFDYLRRDTNISPDIRRLIFGLQIPLLKAALLDSNFFFKEEHPARRLIDTLAKSGVACDQAKGCDDPLYKMIEQIVERVQLEFEQQIELFSDVVSDLENFLDEEENLNGKALAESVAEALRQERMQKAREQAGCEVASRIETGEVAGFVEMFLETQWTHVLTLAHSVFDTRPRALEQARKTMDDLIWSLKPRISPEERKALLTQLPSLLSMLNAWLNVVKWDGPERVLFFSNLAERHAAIVRAPFDSSPRRQVEMAVDAAERASERRLNVHARVTDEKLPDQFTSVVNAIEWGECVEFTRADGSTAKCKLAWVSPRRSRFVFTSRQGHEVFSLSAEELTQIFREGRATIVPMASLIDRALAAAIEEMEAI